MIELGSTSEKFHVLLSLLMKIQDGGHSNLQVVYLWNNLSNRPYSNTHTKSMPICYVITPSFSLNDHLDKIQNGRHLSLQVVYFGNHLSNRPQFLVQPFPQPFRKQPFPSKLPLSAHLYNTQNGQREVHYSLRVVYDNENYGCLLGENGCYHVVDRHHYSEVKIRTIG